jgi:hypothetical protein
MGESLDYGRMISRHIDRLLSIFPSQKVDRVLHLSELHLGREGVTRGGEGPVSSEDAFRYKEALRQIFGEGVFAMARVSFMQSGCGCGHCRKDAG